MASNLPFIRSGWHRRGRGKGRNTAIARLDHFQRLEFATCNRNPNRYHDFTQCPSVVLEAFGRQPQKASSADCRFDNCSATGRFAYADLARLWHVIRARMSQIMDLFLLAGDLRADIVPGAGDDRGRPDSRAAVEVDGGYAGLAEAAANVAICIQLSRFTKSNN